MKKLLTDKRLIVIILVIILVFLLIDFNQRMVLLSNLRKQEKQLEQKYSQLEATRSSLEAELAHAGSDEAVEEWAREEGSMIQEGDIPIILLPPSEPVVSESTPQVPIVDDVEYWQIWQELFLGN